MAGSRETKRGRREVEAFRIEISAFCHGTEDCSRVQEAIKRATPPVIRDDLKIEAISEEGYYGNPITIFTARITDIDKVNGVIQHLASNIDNLEKSILKTTLPLRFDEKTGRLIIRFSKQDLYQGFFRIVDADDIVKVVVYFRHAKRREDVVNYLKQYGLIP